MKKPSTTKIETRALNALESIIDDHLAMEYQFNKTDKEMSWDGYISLYDNNRDYENKDSLEGRIPVQIKGHNDYTERHIGKTQIKVSVELSDLRLYATEKGVIYFQIYIYGTKKAIFYNSLYPSKIADYLDEADRKGNSKKIVIPFNSLKRDPDTLYSVVKQFNREATLQGSAFTPLVRDRIKTTDLAQLTSINLSVIGANNPVSMIKRLGSGDVCLYGKTAEDKYFRPIQWVDGVTFFSGTNVEKKIYVGDELFYTNYNSIVGSDDSFVINVSPNLELRMSEGRFNFSCVSSLKDLYKDARFLLSVKKYNSFIIGEKTFKDVNMNISSETEEWYHFIVDFYETLEMIGIDVKQTMSYYSEHEEQQLIKLVNVKNGAYNKQLPNDINRVLWMFDGKYIPLIIKKDGTQCELNNEVYTEKIKVVLPDPEKTDTEYIMPNFNYQTAEVLSNLYSYDYESFYKQINESDINAVTAEPLLECTLKLIIVYDNNGDNAFLDLAEYLLSKIAPYLEEEFVLLNMFQIQKRKKELSSADIEVLKSIKSEDKRVLFGRSVLLGDRTKAEQYFDLMLDEEKEIYKDYPIYRLFNEL